MVAYRRFDGMPTENKLTTEQEKLERGLGQTYSLISNRVRLGMNPFIMG